MSCPNANALGVPGQGFHATRLGPIALYDTLGTIALAALTTYVFRVRFWISVVTWFVAGEVLHYVFGTPTALLTLLGLTPRCYAEKRGGAAGS